MCLKNPIPYLGLEDSNGIHAFKIGIAYENYFECFFSETKIPYDEWVNAEDHPAINTQFLSADLGDYTLGFHVYLKSPKATSFNMQFSYPVLVRQITVEGTWIDEKCGSAQQIFIPKPKRIS